MKRQTVHCIGNSGAGAVNNLIIKNRIRVKRQKTGSAARRFDLKVDHPNLGFISYYFVGH
jgi:hypothetical protein